jgi:hypothetical protein
MKIEGLVEHPNSNLEYSQLIASNLVQPNRSPLPGAPFSRRLKGLTAFWGADSLFSHECKSVAFYPLLGNLNRIVRAESFGKRSQAQPAIDPRLLTFSNGDDGLSPRT